MIDEDYLMKIHNDIKHWSFRLNDNLIEKFTNELKGEKFSQREFGLIVLCLALGSNFLEENPRYLKSFFKKEMPDLTYLDIFKAIKYNKIEHFYLEELEHYSTLEKFLTTHPVDAESALETLSRIGDGNDRFHRIEKKINKAITYLGKDDYQNEDIMEYIDFCFQILLKINRSDPSSQTAK